MTPQEIQAKTGEKVAKIKELMKELQITVTGEQAVMENGLIKNVVYYLDNEQYPVAEAPKEESHDEASDL